MNTLYLWLLAFLLVAGACRSSREEVGAEAVTLLVVDAMQPCELAHDLKAAFQRVPWVEHVAVAGLDAQMVVVELDSVRLAVYDVSFARAEAAVRSFVENTDLSLAADSARYRVEAAFTACTPPNVEDLTNLVLAYKGQVIPLSAVARVSLRAVPQEAVYHEGQRALRFRVEPMDGHAEAVKNGIEDRLRDAQARFSFTYFFAAQKNQTL